MVRLGKTIKAGRPGTKKMGKQVLGEIDLCKV